jgi:hypothetical protein
MYGLGCTEQTKVLRLLTLVRGTWGMRTVLGDGTGEPYRGVFFFFFGWHKV